MHFAHPFAFWLLPLVFLPWLAPTRPAPRGRAALRTVALLACLVAVAGPTRIGTDSSERLILLLDVSPSVRPASVASARQTLERLRAAWDRGPAELIPWGGGGGPQTLGAALRLADSRIPEGGRGAVLVATAGSDQEAQWSEAVSRLEERDIPVHTMRLDRRRNDARPVSLELFSELRVGQRAVVAVGVEANAREPRVVLEGDGKVLAERDLTPFALRGTAVFDFEPKRPGPLTLSARVLVPPKDDAYPANNVLRRTVFVRPPLEVLYLGWRMEGGRDALAALMGPGFRLRGLPENGELAPALRDVDLVVLDDLPANRFPTSDQKELVRAVREDGVGLFVCGGRGSLAPGGYFKSPLEDILPVTLIQKEEKRDPSTTLVVIIDTSGSMGGTRVQLAKEVARLAIRRLLPHDKVGIVEFYGAKRWAAPIQPASNVIEIQRAINRLDAGGGTVIMPAIEEAYYGLQNVNTRYKHVLVLTDGGVESGAFEPLLRKMAEKGINVSTVLVGPEAHSEFLVNMANWGKGRFYAVPNRFNLPEVILKRPTSARLPVWKTGGFPVRVQGPELFWRGIDRESVPPIGGYLAVGPRAGAEDLIVTAESSHPVLSRWQVGLGRVTVFTSEPAGEGTAGWRRWPGFSSLVARVLARTARDARDDFALEATREGRRIRMLFRATHVGAGRPRGIIESASDVTEPLRMIQRGPGLFEAAAFADPTRDVTVRWGADGKELASVEILSSRRRPEGNTQVDDLRSLDTTGLASATGGREWVRSGAGSEGALTPSSLAAGGGRGAMSLEDLAPWFYLAALVLFLVDVVARRLPRSRRVGGFAS